MEIFGQTSLQSILFFILYGVTGVVPLIAALYLLLCPVNAIAPGITPPVRLRRWAASFFAVIALGHVWWMLFYNNYSGAPSMDSMMRSAGYIGLVVFDYVTMLITFAGTLLSMLQDRRRRIWPVFVAMIPFVVLGGVHMVKPSRTIILIAPVYILLFYVLFAVYMVFAVRRYGRWLNDNYADLENKKVWLSQLVTLACLLLFILYTLVDIDSIILMFFMHFTELALFVLLLWRVETLPRLSPLPHPVSKGSEYAQDGTVADEPPTPLPRREGPGESLDLAQIEKLLNEHCVVTQLYLQHELSRDQLAQAVGTNRSYLSQYFSRQGITYNTYINNLRINHFVSRYEEGVAAGQPVSAQQLAYESGFGSYRTFSRAFTERMGQSVTAWMSKREG
jgi:AraC-like DNA-binding protein